MPQTKPAKPFVPIPDPEQPTFAGACSAAPVAAVDNALPKPLLKLLQPELDEEIAAHRPPTFLNFSSTRTSLIRWLIAHVVLPQAASLVDGAIEGASFEYAYSRRGWPHGGGHAAAAVLFVSNEPRHRQRPVVLFNQSLGDSGSLEPRLPQQVTLCEPQAGRLLVYRADELRAGTLQSDQPRLLIKLWQQPPQPSLPSAADAVIEGLLRHVRAEAPPLLEAARQWPVELATLPVSSSFAQDEASWRSRKLPLRTATHGGRAKGKSRYNEQAGRHEISPGLWRVEYAAAPPPDLGGALAQWADPAWVGDAE